MSQNVNGDNLELVFNSMCLWTAWFTNVYMSAPTVNKAKAAKTKKRPELRHQTQSLSLPQHTHKDTQTHTLMGALALVRLI